MKRFRRLHAKPGQLLVYYGKLPGDNPDICFAWGGEGATRRDGALLHYMFSGKRMQPVYGQERDENHGLPWKFDKSFLEELEARGYDLTTLKFSIQLKRQQPEANPDEQEPLPDRAPAPDAGPAAP